MSKKIPIARNLSDQKSREWWSAIDELASKAPRLELERKPFGKQVQRSSQAKSARVRPTSPEQ